MTHATHPTTNDHATGGEPRFELRTERKHRPAAGGSFHLLLRVIAPEVRNPERQRPPLDLAFVVDRSGSMSGGKLELVKQGVEHALRLLDERDTLSLTAYDDQIEVPTPQRRYSRGTHDGVLRRLRPIQPRGSTNLAGGWLTGCDQLAGIADGSGDLRRREGVPLCRTLLLTDGLANVGMVDPHEIANHAAELRRRGITTTTFGVGEDFDELLLGRMADAGGGRYHYIAGISAVPRVFAGELGELLAVSMRDVTLSLRVPAAWRLELLNTLPLSREGDWVHISLGELSSRDERVLVWEASLPASAEGATDRVEARLRWSIPTGERTSEQALQRTLEARRDPGAPDEAVLDEAARMYGSRARYEALELNRAGRYGAARDVAQSYAARMRVSVAGEVEADLLLADAAPLAAPMSRANLKERHFTQRRTARQQKDLSSQR